MRNDDKVPKTSKDEGGSYPQGGKMDMCDAGNFRGRWVVYIDGYVE